MRFQAVTITLIAALALAPGVVVAVDAMLPDSAGAEPSKPTAKSVRDSQPGRIVTTSPSEPETQQEAQQETETIGDIASPEHNALQRVQLSLQLAESELGADTIELAPVLNQLGQTLLDAGEPDQALTHYQRSASLISDNLGLFHAELLDPLMGQGYALQQMDQHELAINSFRTGQHIVHRNDGVLGLKQLPAIKAIVDSLHTLDHGDDAKRLGLLVYKIHKDKFGLDDPRVTPGLHALASWQLLRKNYRAALATYDQIIEINQSAGNADQSWQLSALRGRVTALGMQRGRKPIRQAIVTQRELIGLLEVEPPTVADQVGAYLTLGDLHIRRGDSDSAWPHYRKALELASVDSENDWDALFKQPKLIDPGPDINYLTDRNGAPPYSKFRTTISADGAPKRIGILETNLRKQSRIFAVQLFRSARFRPRIDEDGAPTETENFSFRRDYAPLEHAPNILPQNRAISY